MTATTNIAAIVLAAGAGRRLGYKPKGLLQHHGQPLLARQISLMAQAGAQSIVVVLGHHADAYTAALQQARVHLPESVQLQSTRTPDPDGGTAASLRCGLTRLASDASAVLVALVDQPLLQTGDVRAVLHAWATRDPNIDLIVPTHNGQPGHPVIFGPALRQELQAQQDQHDGVRAWRNQHPQRVQTLPVTHPRHTFDIDCEADLTTLASEHGIQLRWPKDFSS